MSELHLSRLETGILDFFHEVYGRVGFPLPREITATRRKNTGGGRYVDLKSSATIFEPDGFLDLKGRFIEMSGVPNGLMATIAIEGGKLIQLEIAVFGDDEWDGVEREWRIA